MSKYRIFVFANLKPSQIYYKIVPLSRSYNVDHVFILRKTPLDINEEKITCLYLPWILRQRPLYWIFTFLHGYFQIKKHKTDLILNYNIFPHGLNAFLASKLTKQKVIFSEINEDTLKYYNYWWYNALIKKILRNASIICTPGLQTAVRWNEKGFKHTVQLHSTIDIKIFKPNYSLSKKFDFIYIGVFDNNKRPEILIEAFKELHIKMPKITFCMVGFGERENEINKLIKIYKLENSISVMKSSDVLTLLQQSRIFVMSSLSEGLPCAMMEAMACELIPIVPPVGDIADVIEHNVNGFLHNNSLEDIINKMENALINYNQFGDLRMKARQTIINKHSYQFATSRWNELLNKI